MSATAGRPTIERAGNQVARYFRAAARLVVVCAFQLEVGRPLPPAEVGAQTHPENSGRLSRSIKQFGIWYFQIPNTKYQIVGCSGNPGRIGGA